MLEDLTIKDFALINSVSLEFSKGFTVLSGETGAGKSILIGALSFVLGGKAEIRMIRQGASEASVTATFFLEENDLKISAQSLDEQEDARSSKEWLNLHGIESENDRIIIRRVIRDNGKSSAWIGGVPVTRAELLSFSSFLLDIHGQHEHQSLMKVQEHRKFLDAHARLTTQVLQFTELYANLVEKRKLYEQISASSEDRQRRCEMYSFAIKEIEDAKLKSDEDVKLAEEEQRLSSFEKLYAEIETITGGLSENEHSITSNLKALRRSCLNASEMDSSLLNLSERVESAFYELSDIANEFSSYKNHLVFDPMRLKEVQERLSLIYNLKKKYCASPNVSLSELFAYSEDAKANLERLGNSELDKSALEKEIEVLEKQVYVAAKSLSEKRKAAGTSMAKDVENILSKLGMNGTKFCVQIKDKEGSKLEQKCGPYGMDNIEFLISANPGSPLLPLASIASGGELSRVMLALKTIFASSDPVQSLVFDEIDTGVGGEVAISLGEHLKNLSKNRQIFCITHLASIAVFADNQIKIEKTVKDGKTFTQCYAVSGDERTKEIARMLSGDVSSSSLEHAKALLEKSRT